MMGRALRLQLAILASPGLSVLCFDFDGAPVPIVEHPGDARPLPAALAFCGDDAGDIAGFDAGFDAVRAWRGEGRPGAVVVSGSVEVPVLAERADVLCAGPAGIAAWLGSLADRLAGGGTSSIG